MPFQWYSVDFHDRLFHLLLYYIFSFTDFLQKIFTSQSSLPCCLSNQGYYFESYSYPNLSNPFNRNHCPTLLKEISKYYHIIYQFQKNYWKIAVMNFIDPQDLLKPEILAPFPFPVCWTTRCNPQYLYSQEFFYTAPLPIKFHSNEMKTSASLVGPLSHMTLSWIKQRNQRERYTAYMTIFYTQLYIHSS